MSRFTIPCSLLAALLASAAPALAQQQPELLPPQEAYRLDARVEGDRLLLQYRIEPGYFLYGDKFAAASLTAAVALGELQVPPGEVKQDPWFGRVETHRDEVVVSAPLLVSGSRPSLVEVEARSQGCADVGVCFPPYTHTVSVDLPASPAAGGADGGFVARLSQLTGLDALLGDAAGAQRFLPPEQAFRPRLDVVDGKARLHFDIAEDYYLYRHKLALTAREPARASLGSLVLPAGEARHDEYFGDVQVFYRDVTGSAPLTGVVPGETVTLEVAYQGCADAGLCYPPMTRLLDAVVPAVAGQTGGAISEGTVLGTIAAQQAPSGAVTARGDRAAPLAETDRIARSLVSGSAWLIAVTFFGFGLLLAFTPCVFPMVPILSSLIVGHGQRLSPMHGFTLSVVYVFGMALTYTAAGILAGLFGAGFNLQAAFQNPWVLASFAALFVLLSLSMFGFYQLQLPSAWQTRLTRLSTRQRGGTYAGAGVMGVLSALIVGPCVAAPLAGALIYIGRTGDAVVGGLALFAMALGMGTPLLVIGASAGRLLPKAGAWMDTVKAVFGVLLLAVAIYLLERIVAPWVALLAWAALFIVTAIYLGALDALAPGASGWRRLWKGTGLVMLVYGVLLMVGAAGGGNDPLQPLRGVSLAGAGPTGAPHRGIEFQRVKGISGLETALRRASADGRHVMLDFYADWCVSCKEMERYTFTDAGVQSALAGTVLLQTDVTDNDEADQALLQRFGLYGPPAVLFFGPDGRERAGYRLVGFADADDFRALVEAAQAPEREVALATDAAGS